MMLLKSRGELEAYRQSFLWASSPERSETDWIEISPASPHLARKESDRHCAHLDFSPENVLNEMIEEVLELLLQRLVYSRNPSMTMRSMPHNLGTDAYPTSWETLAVYARLRLSCYLGNWPLSPERRREPPWSTAAIERPYLIRSVE